MTVAVRRIQPPSAPVLNLFPDFCSGRSVLNLVFVMELVAIVLTLASGVSGMEAVERLLLISLYLQWISLCSAGVMCSSRRLFGLLPPRRIFFACWITLVLVVMFISGVSFQVARWLAWDVAHPQQSVVDFVLRHGVIAAIVAFMVLRYFWVRNQWTMQVQAEGEARYQALNARIRPHFLFNALNSLAALIQIRPDDAEMMVEDLSDLFRATLEKRSQVAPLVEEIGLCHAYLRIEKMRLTDNLKVEWDVPEDLLSWPVPKLVVQPLIENAVHHGVSKIKGGGTIRIAAREVMGRLVIEVANPMAASDDGTPSKGNHIAVDNIAQRLSLIYGNGAQLEMGSDQRLEHGVFRARLSIPQSPHGALPDAPAELAGTPPTAASSASQH